MDPLTVAAASGMRSRMESLDMLANNIANASTAGFKADSEFYSLYSSEEAGDGPPELPLVEKPWINYSQGPLMVTGSPTDLAIQGNGFFVAEAPSGRLYTRDGRFQLSAKGVLETSEHYPVAGADGKPIQLNPDEKVEIDSGGAVHQGGAQVAQLALVELPDLDAVSKHQGTYFHLDPSSIPARPARDASVHQGALENANEQPAAAAVRIVSVLRQFEMLQKALSLGSDMNRRAIEEVAKV